MGRPCVRVCFTPGLLKNLPKKSGETVVVVDILRATTSMCTALANGAASIIPVAGGREAVESSIVDCRLLNVEFLVAGEEDGIKLPYADLGNSPLEFTREAVEGKTIVFSTTNGTHAICDSAAFGEVFIASFVNFSATLNFLICDKKDVLIVCAGWKGQFSLEDALFAGKLAAFLESEGNYTVAEDSAVTSVSLWHLAKPDLLAFVSRSCHYRRLIKIESAEGLRYCFDPTEAEVLARLEGERLVRFKV